MCVGVPMRVLEVADGIALCERRGERARLNAMLLGDLACGDYVLSFQGSAVRVLDAAEAAQTDAALDALAAAMQGDVDVDRHFADLVDRVPELPAHLKRRVPT
jgi:hydrogenase expression/formation protein HypC